MVSSHPNADAAETRADFTPCLRGRAAIQDLHQFLRVSVAGIADVIQADITRGDAITAAFARGSGNFWGADKDPRQRDQGIDLVPVLE
jgi:hypothetical protein